MRYKLERWNEHRKPNAAALLYRLHKEGYDVMDWTDAPGTVYPPHLHTEDQCHWVISGELQLMVGPETYTLSAGDRDFLLANTLHAAFVPGEEPVRYLVGVKHNRPKQVESE
jgi:quercetin dioxygenase-like cupin family protein